MRNLLIASLVLAASASAGAAPPFPAGVDIPQNCEQFVDPQMPDSLQGAEVVSVASCLASTRLRATQLGTDAEANRSALAAAIAPSVAMLEQVIADAPPAIRHQAALIESDLLDSCAVRLRASIPAPSVLTGAPLQSYLAAHLAIEPLVQPWLNRGETVVQRVAAAD